MCSYLQTGPGPVPVSRNINWFKKKKKKKKDLNEPGDAKPARASGKVFVYTGMVKGCIFSLNDLKVSASPLLQECGHKCASEAEHEAEEPD